MVVGYITNIIENRGYGFIGISSSTERVFFHFTALEDHDLSNWGVGEKIKVEIVKTEKGLQAKRVKQYDPLQRIFKHDEKEVNRCDYCYAPEDVILEEIKNNLIPNEALIRDCCWRKICTARGWGKQVDAKIWQEICTRRGNLLHRQNPRGF